MKRGFTFITALFAITIFGCSQIPNGYYDSANGLTGDDLREELHQIIKGHSSKSYSSLITHHQSTDKKSNTKVWDMYSDVPGGNPSYEFTFVDDKCGNYGQEGDCYNREHSFPQSWFSSASPMQSDLFHVYPTDGYVNGKRASFPYGNVSTATWTSTNGGKLGSSGTAGYSGTVFEPIDEYKGDFARTYFYMVTRYKDIANGWSSEMLSGNNLSSWAIDLLLEWDKNDPVSQKEIDRNNAVHDIQNNRNPYIDNEDYVDLVWLGSLPDTTTNISNQIEKEFKVFSSDNKIVIENNSEIVSSLFVYNLIGAIVYTNNVASKYQDFIVDLPKGIYLITVGNSTEKIIID